jgi:hypothetical protein
MNANEIIDGLENEILKRYGEGHSCSERNVLREAIRLIDENQKALSRSRIRETATEPPTMEDGGRFDGVQEQVLAMNHCGHFVSKFFEIVRRFPDKYPKWTCVPQLPEVE